MFSFKNIERRAFLDLQALGKRSRRRLTCLVEADNFGTVHRHAGRDFLIIFHADIRCAGHDQAGSIAVFARQPRAVVLDHLAIFVEIHVFAKIIDVFRAFAHREEISRNLVQLAALPFSLFDDAGGNPVDRSGFIENSDLELRIVPLQDELKAGLHDEVLISTRRQQIAI